MGMKKISFISILFLLLSINGYSQHDHLRKEIDKIIRYDTDIEYPEHQGFIVGIIDNDSTYILNFGTNYIDTFDIFELGGLTKVFTSLVSIRLSEMGLINLEEKVNNFFPLEYRNSNLDEWTLADLLMHQIPFPKRPSDLSKKEYNISDPYAYYTKEDLLNYYSSFKPRPKLRWSRNILHYSHINFALIEIILENQLKSPFEDILHSFLLTELEMNCTSSIFPADSISLGFDKSNMIPDPWTFQSFAGSEGIASNLNDLILLMKNNLNTEQCAIQNTVNQSQIIQKQSKVSKILSHSFGWYVLQNKNMGTVYTHSGGTERHRAYMHFKPSTKTGVVILSRSSKGTGELGMLILRMINYNWRRKDEK